MSQYCSCSELKNTAKEMLAGRYRSVISLTIFVSLMVVPLAYLQAFLEELPQLLQPGGNTLFWDILLYLLSGVFIALGSLFSIGLYLFHLKLACKQPFALADLWYCFRDGHFSRTFMVSFWVQLPELICSLPFAVCSQLFIQNQSSAMAFYMAAAFIAGTVILIPINLALSMSYFIMLDFPEYSAKDVLFHSIKLMKGNKGRLFCIEISFLPLHLLGICSMGIGYLWLTPYVNMTHTLFFLDLMNPSHKNTAVM